MSDIDYSAVGPCDECCEVCSAYNFKSTAVLVFSGITICPCTGGTMTITATVNGAFTLVNSGFGLFGLTIPNAVTYEIWTGPNCSGTSTTATYDLILQFQCSLASDGQTVTGQVVMSDNGPLGTEAYFEHSGSEPDPITGVLPNANPAPNCATNDGPGGGTCTISV